MKRSQMIALAGVFVVVLILAFALQDIVRLALVIPLAYLWWVLGLLVGAVPQVILWGILVAAITILLFNSLTAQGSRSRLVEVKHRSSQGNIEILAKAIEQAHEGIYAKWLLANRLGRLARDLLIQRGVMEETKSIDLLAVRNWQLSESVRAYLNVGLTGSFADYPNRRWLFKRPKPTPLDIEIDEAVEFLETKIRTS